MEESQLLDALDCHDDLVWMCVRGELSILEFVYAYDDFWWRYALDGHESDLVERQLLERLEPRLAIHRDIAGMLSGFCRDEDADDPRCRAAERFGSAEAMERLQTICARHFLGQEDE